jgi:catecholate siderophore receptor
MKLRVKRHRKPSARRETPWVAAGTFAAYTALGTTLATPALAWEPAEGEAGEVAPQGQLPVRRFDIRPGPLAAALSAFEATSGVRVVMPAGGVTGFESPGVTGEQAADRALAQILRGTPLTFRFQGPSEVVLQLRASESVEVTGHARELSSPKQPGLLREVPQTITVIPSAIIQEQNATSLRDVLRNVPGITMQAGEGGVPAGDNLSIRGFSARTDFFIDGVRDFGGYARDPYNLDQVEVSKGPASAFVGRGSTGGSVNLVTKSPQGAALRAISVGAGNESYQRGTADLNQPLDAIGVGNAAFRLNAMWTDAGTPGRGPVENSRWGVSPSLAFGIGRPLRALLNYSHLDQDNLPDYGLPWVPVNTGPLAAYSGRRPPVEQQNWYGLLARDYEKTSTDVSTAQVEYDVNRSLTLRNHLRWGRNYRDSVITAPRFANINSPTAYTQINRQLQSRDMTDRILSNQTSLSGRFHTGSVAHSVSAGVEFAREESENFLRTGPTAPLADLFEPDFNQPHAGPITRTGAVNDGQARSAAAYLFDTIGLGDRLDILTGARYDHFGVEYASRDAAGVVTPFERDDDLLSWRAAAVYKPTPRGSVYAGASSSFNPSAEALSLSAATVNLDPEETRTYEVGSKWDLAPGGRLSVSAALFRTEKTNARTPGLNPGDPPTVLAGKQRVDGVELSAVGNLGRRVSVLAGYAHMKSEIEASNTAGETGNALAQVPENTFNLWLTLNAPSRLTLGGGVQYMDSVFRNALNTLQAPSYWLIRATAAYELNTHLTLRLNGDNLADVDYVDRVGGGHYIPGPARQVMFSADLRF